jgi:hypothetical protein
VGRLLGRQGRFDDDKSSDDEGGNDDDLSEASSVHSGTGTVSGSFLQCDSAGLCVDRHQPSGHGGGYGGGYASTVGRFGGSHYAYGAYGAPRGVGRLAVVRHILRELWLTVVGACLAVSGITCFAMQSRTNYWLMHSFWHLLVMSSSYFLMKGRNVFVAYMERCFPSDDELPM